MESYFFLRCKGSLAYCVHASLGCDFQGPRSALPSHLQECTFSDYVDGKNLLYIGFLLFVKKN